MGTVCGQCVGGFQLGEQVSVAGGWLFEVDVPCSALRDIVGMGCHKIEWYQQKVLKTRYFRQDARKSEGNFCKKREGWTVPALLTELNIKAPELFLKKLKFRIVFTVQ